MGPLHALAKLTEQHERRDVLAYVPAERPGICPTPGCRRSYVDRSDALRRRRRRVVSTDEPPRCSQRRRQSVVAQSPTVVRQSHRRWRLSPELARRRGQGALCRLHTHIHTLYIPQKCTIDQLWSKTRPGPAQRNPSDVPKMRFGPYASAWPGRAAFSPLAVCNWTDGTADEES